MLTEWSKQVIAQPGAARVVLAVLEDAVESVAGGADQLEDKGVAGPVDVGEKDQASCVGAALRVGGGGQDEEAAEVDGGEPAEGDEGVVGGILPGGLE